jgi:hypothetical protein
MPAARPLNDGSTLMPTVPLAMAPAAVEGTVDLNFAGFTARWWPPTARV